MWSSVHTREIVRAQRPFAAGPDDRAGNRFAVRHAMMTARNPVQHHHPPGAGSICARSPAATLPGRSAITSPVGSSPPRCPTSFRRPFSSRHLCLLTHALQASSVAAHGRITTICVVVAVCARLAPERTAPNGRLECASPGQSKVDIEPAAFIT